MLLSRHEDCFAHNEERDTAPNIIRQQQNHICRQCSSLSCDPLGTPGYESFHDSMVQPSFLIPTNYTMHRCRDGCQAVGKESMRAPHVCLLLGSPIYEL